jgi:hypothetical protein
MWWVAPRIIENEYGACIKGWRLEIEESVSFLEAVSPLMPAKVQVIACIFHVSCLSLSGCCVRRFSPGFCEMTSRIWLPEVSTTGLLEPVMFPFAIHLCIGGITVIRKWVRVVIGSLCMNGSLGQSRSPAAFVSC